MPELMVVWTYNRIGRNIVIFINFENKEIELEHNAWVDISNIQSEKIVKIRDWTNKKYHMFSIPDNYKITKEFQRDYDIKLIDSLQMVNDLDIKDLDQETVLSIE